LWYSSFELVEKMRLVGCTLESAEAVEVCTLEPVVCMPKAEAGKKAVMEAGKVWPHLHKSPQPYILKINFKKLEF
jgi:hypothetical protein